MRRPERARVDAADDAPGLRIQRDDLGVGVRFARVRDPDAAFGVDGDPEDTSELLARRELRPLRARIPAFGRVVREGGRRDGRRLTRQQRGCDHRKRESAQCPHRRFYSRALVASAWGRSSSTTETSERGHCLWSAEPAGSARDVRAPGAEFAASDCRFFSSASRFARWNGWRRSCFRCVR